MTIIINTDGGARNNQNNNGRIIAGWGAVLKYQGNKKKIKGFQLGATNNQMELTAMIEALKALTKTDIPVEVYADSNYVIEGINWQIVNWEKNNWKNSTKKPVKNLELWQELLALKRKFKSITFSHVLREFNTEADALSNEAMDELKAKVMNGEL